MKNQSIIFGKAKLTDAQKIMSHLRRFRKMMISPKAVSEIQENIRDYFIAKVDSKIIGTIAIHFISKDSTEIRSLAVDKNFEGKGVGSRLVELALYESKIMAARKAYVRTCLPGFYSKLRFKKSKLPKELKPLKGRIPMMADLVKIGYLLTDVV